MLDKCLTRTRLRHMLDICWTNARLRTKVGQKLDCRFVPLRLALPLQAALFGMHHQALGSLLPLSALGLLWGLLYVASANLLVPVLVHALWNSRIFLVSLQDLLATVLARAL